jgi:hypothetical protein
MNHKLTIKEWEKRYVIRWQGVKDCDTHTVEGGYLFVRDDEGGIIGLGTYNASNRKEAVQIHYSEYIEGALWVGHCIFQHRPETRNT